MTKTEETTWIACYRIQHSEFKIDNKVLLNTQNISRTKLNSRSTDSFKLLLVDKSTYKLQDLFNKYNLIFHILLLKLYYYRLEALLPIELSLLLEK